jgi:NTE family protein
MTKSVDVRASRALVLGGGALLGRALHWGLIAGFLEEGLDLRDADLILGTSAGAIMGARFALGEDPRLSPTPLDPPSASAPLPNANLALQQLTIPCAKATLSSAPEEEWKAIGAMALAADTVDENAAITRPTIAALNGRPWPGNFRATAVNAFTGQPQLWGPSSGVPLDRAVASSSALPGVWPPITLDGGRYVDGAVRSMLNADLAKGFERVVVISCFDLSSPSTAPEPAKVLNRALHEEIEHLRAQGSSVELITPDEEFMALSEYGAKMFDASRVPAAYGIAKAQARREADRIRRNWTP